jgi:hypothetical protein
MGPVCDGLGDCLVGAAKQRGERRSSGQWQFIKL